MKGSWPSPVCPVATPTTVSSSGLRSGPAVVSVPSRGKPPAIPALVTTTSDGVLAQRPETSSVIPRASGSRASMPSAGMLGRRSPKVTRIVPAEVWMTRPPVSLCTLAVVQPDSGVNPGTGRARALCLLLSPLPVDPPSGDWFWRPGSPTWIRAWAEPMIGGTDSAMLTSLVAIRVMPLVSSRTGRPTIVAIRALRHL